jgi:hypothetical protein
MRQAEACGLGWDRLEIDQEPFILRIVCQAGQSWHLKHPDWKRPADPTKTKKPRSQILHPTVVLILRAQRAELQSRGWFRCDGPVFPAHGGRWRTTGEVVKPETMRRIAQDAGLPNAAEWVTHSTRHSFATLEAVASRDLKATQARTGHSSIQQLDSYLHAAGLYLGRSAVPELPVHVAPVVATPEPGVEICRTGNPTVKLDSWGFDTLERPPDITETDLVSARSWQSDQAAERRALRAESERSFSDLAAEWLQRPENTRNGYPPAVRLAAKRAYCRAYRVAQRQSCSGAACSKAGQRAGIACRAAWAKQIKAALAKMSQAKPLK